MQTSFVADKVKLMVLPMVRKIFLADDPCQECQEKDFGS